MLEIYRSCPKCGAHAKATDSRCVCGEKLGVPLGQPEVSLRRRMFDYALLAMLGAAVVGGLLRPDWYQALAGGRVMESVRAAREGRSIWTGSAAEPKARGWAWKLESSLTTGCNTTYAQAADKKLMSGMLNFQLVGGTLAASKHTQEVARRNHQKIPWMTPEEVADGARAIGSYDDFLAACLTRGYAALEPCEEFKEALGSPQAAACVVAPVQRMLGGLAWRICASNATQPRVKELCQVAAERMEALPQAGPPGTPSAPGI